MQYDDIMGALIARAKADNQMHIPIIRKALCAAAEYAFIALKALMLPPVRVGHVSDEEFFATQLRYNDSVSYLRTRHATTINKIHKSTFGYRR